MRKKDILKQIEDEVKEEAVKEEQKKEQIEKTKERLEQMLEERKKVDLSLDNLKGVGTTISEKLKIMGVYDVMDLAASSAPGLWNMLGDSNKSLEWCTNLIVMANRYLQENGVLEKPLTTSKILLENETVRKRFSTGDEGLDNFFGGGGIESKAITELYGKYQVGKTQICDCTAVVAAANDRKVLFIDTENTYSPTRIDEIATVRGYDVDKVHENIRVLKPNSSSMLALYIRDLRKYIRENNFELIIIDSIIALHRAEYLGRAFLASRQQGLAEIMGNLIRIAEVCDIGVIITNQVLDSPDPFKVGSFATGGNIIAHSSTHRVFLKSKGKLKGGKNIFLSLITMEDSPRYPRIERVISLRKEGVKLEDASKMDSSEEE